VPDLNPPFIDLMSVTSGWDCVRRGVDVMASNPCDPGRRPANYPRMWLWFSHLGLGANENTLLGVLLVIVFFFTAFVLVRRGSLLEGVAYSAALISPSVMLGVERGNPDLVVFALLVLALAGWIAWRRREVTASDELSAHGDLALDGFVAGAGIFVGSFVFSYN
jgi:LPXTG-motif cell wall-anchored protein